MRIISGSAKLSPNPLSSRWRNCLNSLLSVENGLIALFFGLGLLGILNHEIWRDEAQAWLIARDSSSLGELYDNTRYEGHPMLWHACLFLIARWTHNPFAMQIFHLLLAVGSVVLIVKKSPFSLVQKGLLSFSYLLFYEYSVISRNYAIGVFLTFLFCVLYARRNPVYWLLALVLALIANTSAFNFLISPSFASVMLLRISSESKPSRTTYQHLLKFPIKQTLPTLAILIAGWVFCLMQLTRLIILPETDGPLDVAQVPSSVPEAMVSQTDWAIASINRITGLVEPFSRVYFPMIRPRLHFWSTHLLTDVEGLGTLGGLEIGNLLAVTMAVAIVFFALRALSKTPLYLWLYVSASLSLYSFFVIIYRGSTRHNGHLMILLIASLWLATWSINQKEIRLRDFSARAKRPVVGGALLTVLLIFQCVSGVQAYAIDMVYPFSASRAIAHYIQDHQLENLPLFAQNGRLTTGVTSYLETDAYYAQAGKYASFADTLYDVDKETDEIITANVEDFAQQQPEFLIVSINPIDFSTLEDEVVLLTKVEKTIVRSERMYLYKADFSSE